MSGGEGTGCELEYKMNVGFRELCMPFMAVEEYVERRKH